MPATRSLANRFSESALHASQPLLARWNVLTPVQRTLATVGAIVIFILFIVAFAVLPAIDARAALSTRLPQMESQLALMRSQAREVATLAKQPPAVTASRTAVNVANLQVIFGPYAQISTVPEGFRVILPATEYASWWDKTGEAIGAYALVLREASLVRAGGPTPSTVEVDMRLALEAKPATSPGGTGTTSAGK